MMILKDILISYVDASPVSGCHKTGHQAFNSNYVALIKSFTREKTMKSNYLGVFLLLTTFLLQACGTAHIQPTAYSNDLDQYDTAYISSINIQSREQNGDSLEMNKKMEQYAQKKLGELFSENRYQQVDGPGEAASLAFNLKLDIIYGSRAARYWGGFGAGKGSVNSTIEVVDSKTQEVKFSSSGASDLSMGAFGGSMEAVIKQNIELLLMRYFLN